jgi:hypothetical protein
MRRLRLFNSAILPRLIAEYEENTKIPELIKKIPLAAWRHFHLNGLPWQRAGY